MQKIISLLKFLYFYHLNTARSDEVATTSVVAAAVRTNSSPDVAINLVAPVAETEEAVTDPLEISVMFSTFLIVEPAGEMLSMSAVAVTESESVPSPPSTLSSAPRV